MSYLVDTNVLSELARTQPDSGVVAWLRLHEPQIHVSAISIGELRRGIERLPNGKRKTGLQSWFAGLCQRMDGRILSFNTSTAHVWGQLLAAWEKNGLSLPALDGQIAATAHRHSLTVVTRNVSDFAKSGIKTFNPFS